MEQIFPLVFAGGERAAAVRLEAPEEVGDALSALGLAMPRPVLVLTGGASRATHDELASIEKHVPSLAAAAASVGAAIVDGGTDVGVMRAVGEARARLASAPPLVGVAPAARVALPGEPPREGTYPLEPHHTHFVLVPGSDFGAESPWIARIASEIARTQPSLTVLLGGGAASWTDAAESVGAGRRVLALAGTGRAADELAEGQTDRARRLIDSGLVESLDLRQDRGRLRAGVEERLSGG